MIGLGNLGMALAKQMVDQKHSVTVWNRSQGKAEEMRSAGAKVAATVPEAITASDVVIICLLNYTASDEWFRTEDAAKALKGKTVIQITTGSPTEARDGAKWFTEQGAVYLDGCILDEPSGVGSETFTHGYSGPKAAFETCKPLLVSLGPNVIFLGEDPGLAAAFDCGILSMFFTSLLGFVHGAAICQQEGVPLDVYSETAIASLQAVVIPMQKSMGKYMAERNYPGDAAKLSIFQSATQRISGLCEGNGVDKALPSLVEALVKQAVADGHADSDFSAIFEVLLKKVAKK